MLRRYAIRATFIVFIGLLFVPVARANTHVTVQFGSPAAIVAPVPVAAPYGYIWQPGYYVWAGFRYRWVPGAWVRPLPPRRVWVPERQYERRDWDRNGRDWDRRDRDYDRRDWDRNRAYERR
jgi:YXWGXW repeat-containing protein